MANSTRLTISPDKSILAAINGPWPVAVPKHRLMRLALQRGLDGLAGMSADEFVKVLTADALARAGIQQR